MPSQTDLDNAVASVRSAIDAAALRVIEKLANPVSQASLDALNEAKNVADGIAPDSID